MSKYPIIALGIFANVGSCGGALDDFSNNLATDLGPLLVLLGEPMTKQYLSESTSFIDYIIFALAPIGVLTAMASAIRVCGHPSIRAFIGRSQEGQATVEVELCTSTSRDVCELFNRGGITRVLGRPSILELVHFTRSGEQSQVDDKTADTYLLRHYLQDAKDSEDSEWIKISGESTDFAKNPPNLSLNVGIVRRPNWVFRAVALLGFVLQGGLVVLAAVGAWKLGWAVNQTGSLPSRNYAPMMYIIGTALMSTGMWGCAAVIGQTTDEVQYKRKQSQSGEAKVRGQLFWLQPGPQFIGDQCFNSFAYTEDVPLPIWTSSTKLSGDRFKYWSMVAVGAALVGYIMQFIGLRGMRAWLSITQLAVTVIMSVARGALRAQRLTSAANRLTDSQDAPEVVSGHELDWMAFEILKCSIKRDLMTARGCASSETLVWYVTSRHEQATAQADDTLPRTHGAQQHDSGVTTEQSGTHGAQQQHGSGATTEQSSRRDPDLCKRLLLIRTRLAGLTGHTPFGATTKGSQRWRDEYVKVRRKALQVSDAICQAAAELLKNRESKTDMDLWIGGATSPSIDGQAIDIVLRPPSESTATGWQVDSARLEAVLGLWMWSIISGGNEVSDIPFAHDKGVIRGIISAAPDDTKWRKTADKQRDMDFWLGSQRINFEEAVIELGDKLQPGLHDVWVKHPDPCQASEEQSPLVEQEGAHGRDQSSGKNKCTWKMTKTNLLGSQWPVTRFCGWSTKYGQLPTRPTDPNPRYYRVQTFQIVGSLLDICARELFTSLVVPLVKMGSCDMDVSLTQSEIPDLRLQNQNIVAITTAFREKGLGSTVDAYLNIIPAFGVDISTKNSSETLFGAIRTAENLTKKMEWGKAEQILRWACSQYSPEDSDNHCSPLFETIFSLAGKLYHKHPSHENSDDFRRQGANWMQTTYGYLRHTNPKIDEILRCTKILPDCGSKRSMHGPEGTRRQLLDAVREERREHAVYHMGCLEYDECPPISETLPLAARNRWCEVVILLLQRVFANARDRDGFTGLHWAVQKEDEIMTRLFLHNAADVHLTAADGRTALFMATEKSNSTIVRILLESGAKANATKYNRTPLQEAVLRGHADIADKLLKKGAEMKAFDSHGRTMVHCAALEGCTEVMTVLLKNGADMDIRDNDGRTAMHCAASEGYTEVVTVLLENGADMDIRDNDGRTPLHQAVLSGCSDAAMMLTSVGADLNAQDYSGNTPLHYAAERRNMKLVEILLHGGASTGTRNNFGCRPIDMAPGRAVEIVEALSDAQKLED